MHWQLMMRALLHPKQHCRVVNVQQDSQLRDEHACSCRPWEGKLHRGPAQEWAQQFNKAMVVGLVALCSVQWSRHLLQQLCTHKQLLLCTQRHRQGSRGCLQQ